MVAHDWVKYYKISHAGIAHATINFDNHSNEYDTAVDNAAEVSTTNAAYYVKKHKDLKSLALVAYLGLVAAAELQMATAHVVRLVATGRIERITHPELSVTGVCPKCKELEGVHEGDDNELYWSHPNCCCEWRPEQIPIVSSHAHLTNDSDKSDNQYRNPTVQASKAIGRGKNMDSIRLAEVVKFKNYSKETREEF